MRGRLSWILGLMVALSAGCVERRYVIESHPPGAMVLVNGQPLGATPVDGHFLYYGKYQLTLIKDGYETLQVEECFRPPWYQWYPIDFLSENVWPGKIEDVRRPKPYQLLPKAQPRADELLNQADQFRNKGRSIESPPTS
ncbi:MAG: PEGA domain-containing protein [Gemmataceae bacterium]